MAVLFKIKKYVKSDSNYNGYYFGQAVMIGEADLNQIAERIQRNCSMKRSDVKAVLDEFVEVVTDYLQNSFKVKIDGFGTFKMGLRTRLAKKVDEFGTDNIKGMRVVFHPQYTVDANGVRTTAMVTGARAQAYGEYEAGVNDNQKA